MKVSTRGRYGLHLMLKLALCPDNEPLSLKNIALEQGLPDKYLEQIVSLLQKGGLVQGIRGAGGGYRLTRLPRDMTMGEILRVLEGTTAPTECAEAGVVLCDKAESCAVADLLSTIRMAVDRVVDGMTLFDLAEQHKEKMRSF